MNILNLQTISSIIRVVVKDRHINLASATVIDLTNQIIIKIHFSVKVC
jgi:hypothetical protein